MQHQPRRPCSRCSVNIGFWSSFFSAPSITFKMIMLPYVLHRFPFVLLFFLQWERKRGRGEGERKGRRGGGVSTHDFPPRLSELLFWII